MPKVKPTEPEVTDRGMRIADDIRLGRSQRDLKADRWGLNRAYYFNDPPERENPPYEGATDSNFNLTQVFCDALGGWVVGTLTSQEPYCVPSLPGTAGTDKDAVIEGVQNTVWQRLKKAKFRKALKKVAQPASWCNSGIVWVSWDESKGLTFSVLDPRRFVVYPSSRGISDCLLYGRSFDRTRGEIRSLTKKGYYTFDADALNAGGGGQSRREQDSHPGINDVVPYQSANRAEDDLIELHEVVVRNPEDGSVKIFTIHEASGEIGKEADFPYKTPCAFVFRYKEEATDEFWTEGSVAQDVQGLQTMCNEAINLYGDGMRMASFGATFAGPGGAGAAKVVRYGPGSITRDAGLADAKTFAPSVDVSTCLPLIQFIKAHTQEVVRLSALGQGAPLKKGANTTAAEIQAVQVGQSTGVEDYVDTFSDSLPELFAHVQELIYMYDDEAKADPKLYQSLAQEYDWNVQVVSPSQTPASQMQAIAGLFQLGQNPAVGFDQREAFTRVLRLVERQGVTDASGLQKPQNPDDITMQTAQELGIDPLILAHHVAQAIAEDHLYRQQQQQQAQLQAGGPAQGQGMGGQPNSGVLPQLGIGQAPGQAPGGG